MVRPALHLFVDGTPVGRLAAPASFGERDWILGVAAVQVVVEGERVAARLRAHATGAGAPTVVPLGAGALVHVALATGASPSLPPLAAPRLDGAAAKIALSLDGAPVAEVALAADALVVSPPPRAFGHVFCRWLRDGAAETGYDLTDFLALPPGEKYGRLVSGSLAVGQVVGYAFAAHATAA